MNETPSLTPATDLVKAIRSGHLSLVQAALEAGAPVELHDGKGPPGLPLAIACFMGHADIVRELIRHGAQANLPDNRVPTSPLSMAIRGGKKEVIKVLIEMGTEVPADMPTGLSEQEMLLAHWKAHQSGAAKTGEGDNAPPAFEEIQVTGCYGTDTLVLEAELTRATRDTLEKKNRS